MRDRVTDTQILAYGITKEAYVAIIKFTSKVNLPSVKAALELIT